LNDFGYFRSRYFARSSSPWIEEAAEKMVVLAESPNKEYVVVNQPPGTGKSTAWTHDFPLWLAVRDRQRRTMIIGVPWLIETEVFLVRLTALITLGSTLVTTTSPQRSFFVRDLPRWDVCMFPCLYRLVIF
jgi:hypothetical protein